MFAKHKLADQLYLALILQISETVLVGAMDIILIKDVPSVGLV